MASIFAVAKTSAFSLLLRHFQSLPTPQPVNPRSAGTPKFFPEQRGDSAIAESRSLTYQLQHSIHQRPLIITRLRLVTLTRARLTRQPTRPSLGDRKLRLELYGRLPLPGRAQKFPSATYFSIWMSKAWSATNR